MRTLLLTATMVTAFAIPVHAKSIAMPTGCTMQTTINIGINFNFQAASLADAKKMYDDKMQQIANFAKQMELEKFEPQSMNYNIYAQNNNNMQNYSLNGGVQYQMKSEEVAFKFAEFLEKQKFQVNVNSNSYRQGNCPN